MARQLTTCEGPLLTNNKCDSDDEGGNILTIPTIPTYKKLRKYKQSSSKSHDNKLGDIMTNQYDENEDDIKENQEDDIELKKFIKKYKLNQLEKILLNEGITIKFLISLCDEQIDEISKELTSKLIQQNKFKFAVNELKKDKKKNDDDIDIIYDDNNNNISHKHDKNDKCVMDKKTEIIKPKHFGAIKAVTTWIYIGSDNLKHEIILKYYTKLDKNMKSKRIIIIDGKERYCKKSNDSNFIIDDCCDNIRIAITYNDDKTVTFYDLFINEICFDDLMHRKSLSFSL